MALLFHLLEKFRDTNMVVKIAPLSLRRALNFFKQSTVSCLWTMLATRSRCWKKRSENERRHERRHLHAAYANPWVLERFIRANSLWRVHRQHLVDEIFGFWSHRVPFWWRVLQAKKAIIGCRFAEEMCTKNALGKKWHFISSIRKFGIQIRGQKEEDERNVPDFIAQPWR